ncbi:MAG: hypothetical protein AAF438_12105, partial [Pseudomonadota bacterium]
MKISHIPAALAMVLTTLVGVDAKTSGWPEPLAEALEAMAHQQANYAYTREAWDDLGHYVERFDPSKPRSDQWQLVSFDDAEPKEEHRNRYAKEYEGLFNRDHPADIELADLIDRESLSVTESTPTTITYRFKPRAEDPDDQKFMSHVDGTLLLDTEKNLVKEIRLANSKKFSPAAMVSIKKFSLTMNFDFVN